MPIWNNVKTMQARHVMFLESKVNVKAGRRRKVLQRVNCITRHRAVRRSWGHSDARELENSVSHVQDTQAVCNFPFVLPHANACDHVDEPHVGRGRTWLPYASDRDPPVPWDVDSLG